MRVFVKPGFLQAVRPMAVLLLAGAPAGGCSVEGTVVGAGAAAGIAAAEERGLEGAVDDLSIDLNIKALYLAEDPDLVRRVGTEIVEGRVLLTGVVETPEDRLQAGRLAWQAPGVRQVINEIDVEDKTSFAAFASDTVISAKLRSRLMRDREISAINYSIETVRSVIYLMGIAQHEAERQRVIAHARDISGVRNVVDYTELKGSPERRARLARFSAPD